jgi:tetratricopeptide (TPR) repeat protein
MLRSVFRVSFALVALAALSAAALAQRDSDPSLPGASFEVSGQVRAASGQETVANVVVKIERFSGGVVDQVATDGTGRFRFSRLAPGQYVVSATAEGYAVRTQQLDINRLIPRQYVVLQLQPVEATFRVEKRNGVVDASVPEKAREEFEKGEKALHSKKPDEAITHLETAARLAPDFFEAHTALAEAHMQAQHWEQAERELRRALEIKPKATATLITLGEVYRKWKKYAEAEKTLVEALKLDRGSWQGHFTLGRVYYESGEVAKAAPHVGQSLAINPDYPEGHLLAGNIFMRLSMPQNALVEYEEYLRLAPSGEFSKQTAENVAKLRKALSERKP